MSADRYERFFLMGGKGAHRQCVICGLRERHKGDRSLFFACFPTDPARCKEWVRLVGDEDLVHIPILKLRQLRHVCGDHFERRDFNKKGNRVKRRANPKLNLTAPPLTEDQMIGFPFSMATSLPQAENNPSVEHSSGIASGSKTDECQQNKDGGSGKRKQDDGTAVTARKKILVDVSIVQTDMVSEAVASTSTSVQTQNIQYGNASGSKTDEYLQKKRGSGKSKLEDVVATRKKLLVDVSNVQTDMVSEAVASTSTNVQTQNIQYGCTTLARATRQTSVSKENKENLQLKPNEDILELTPRKKKMMQQLRKTRCTLRGLKKSAKLIEDLDSEVLKGFVMSAFKNQKRKPQGRRWTPKNKISALAIYKRSPTTYRYMAHTMPIPSVKTLQNLLKKVPMETGINQSVLAHLTKKSEKAKKKDKLCCLLFDEMALKRRLHFDPAADKVEGFEDFGGGDRTKEMADHALVFMLQGVRAKYKMPLAYYFTKGTISSQKLAAIIKEIVVAVEATGFKIVATVCDQGPTNLGAMNVLKVGQSPEENSFFTCGKEKIFTIFDVPHLFKSLRNNFYNNGVLLIEDKKAQWSHLVKMEEKNRNMLYLSKISKNNTEPKYRAKMKVKFAAQLLSRQVSAVLKLMAEAERDPKMADEIMETGEIVFELDRLFDYTNGPSGPGEVKKGIRENVSSRTNHLDVWTEYRKKLKTLKFVKLNGQEARNVKCIQGYITTLSAFQDLWNKLRSEGYTYLNLRQLNQDAIENLFGIIRQHSPTNRNPTCSSFVAALKTSIITKLTAPHSRGSNCSNDYNELLTDFHDLLFEETEKKNHENPISKTVEETENEDETFPVLSIPDETDFNEIESNLADLDQQPVVYVSGYIAATILKGRSCTVCADSLKVDEPEDDPVYSYISLREWWQNKRSLTYPTVELCRLVETAVKVFEAEIVPCLYYLNICKLTVTLFLAKCDASFLKCEEHRRQILDCLYFRLGCLLIRRQCQRINQGLAMNEEALSDDFTVDWKKFLLGISPPLPNMSFCIL